MSLHENPQPIVIKRVLILSVIVIGIFYLTIPNPKPYVYGMIFGASINILNFRLMALTLGKSANMPEHKIMPYVVGNYFIRYIIYGLVLTIAAFADYISIYSTIFGFFMVKIVILTNTFYDMIRGNKNQPPTIKH